MAFSFNVLDFLKKFWKNSDFYYIILIGLKKNENK